MAVLPRGAKIMAITTTEVPIFLLIPHYSDKKFLPTFIFSLVKHRKSLIFVFSSAEVAKLADAPS